MTFWMTDVGPKLAAGGAPSAESLRWLHRAPGSRRRQWHVWAGMAGVIAALAGITWLTHTTGGTTWVAPHLYYLPVVAGAFLGGWQGGLLVALVAGLLCGPVMPLNVADGTPQPTINWLMRMGFFALVGGFSGGLFTMLFSRIRGLDRLTHESVRAFVKAVDAKSNYTARHSEKVAAYAVVIGESLGLSSSALRRLFWAGLLHDIGKIRVPDAVLDKPGRLTEHEWEIVRQHPRDSAHMIEDIPQFAPCLHAVRHHHERMDGQGYPDGLSADQLSLDARIMAVADAFEAMTSDRPYRPGMVEDEAIERLRAGAGSQFDPEVVEVLARAHAAGLIYAKGDRNPIRQRAHDILAMAG